jgi:hypothetical protein
MARKLTPLDLAARKAVPLVYVSPRAPAARALQEAKHLYVPFSINPHVPAYRGRTYVGVF